MTSRVSAVGREVVDQGYLLPREDRALLEDVGFALCRALFLLASIFVSVLILRVGTLTLGDLLLMGSTLLMATLPHPLWWPRFELNLTRVALLLIMIGGGLATMVSPSPMESFLVVFRLVYLGVVIPWQVAVLFPSERLLRLPFIALGLGGAANGVATLMQFAGLNIIPGAGGTNANRFPGFASHVSDTGGMTAMGVVIGFGLLGRSRWSRRDWVAVVILILSLVGVVLSGSVSGMMAAALGIVVIAVLGGLSSHKLRITGLIGAVSAVVASYLISLTAHGLSPIERVLQVFGATAQYQGLDTSASRMQTIEIGWRIFGQHPFTGVGLDLASSLVMGELAVHNLAVGLLYGGGIFLFAGVMGLIMGRVADILRDYRALVWGPMCVGLCAMALFFAMTAPSLYNRYLWMPLAMTAAAVMVVRKPNAANAVDH